MIMASKPKTDGAVKLISSKMSPHHASYASQIPIKKLSGISRVNSN